MRFAVDMPPSLRLHVDVKSTPELAIGDLAAHFGLATHVLRHWESVGLLAPRRVSGRRRYGRDDLYRVAIILRAKQAGLGLDAIGEMLAPADLGARQRIMQRHRDELRRRIDELQASLDLVECALDCDHADIATCPNFQRSLDELADPASAR
ncbi:MerR family transcriptional regulator [Saccharopolyspora oryzae]|uniref:MerR family transcriptional regulator n=1 Tax=Saccharopolyspora oryzae TaxID=2997343 RepID=A0ABT4UYF7_9PSEU|nr:MerR family transcriptional regulator [Saccharopolyspora oryzae]MDA3626742.1 MerR family transcriptional regulator [Saccharopolyspora oryzae]